MGELHNFSSSGQELASVVHSVQSSTSSQVEKRKQVSEKGKLGGKKDGLEIVEPVSGKIGEECTLGLSPASSAAILDGFDAWQRAQSMI